MVSSSSTITTSSSINSASNNNSASRSAGLQQQECHLDELGYCFVKTCIETIEARGLDEQGLYRISGVNSRVHRLLQMCLNRSNFNEMTGQVNMPDFSDPIEWENKTITSALKHYLRNLSEPLMTYTLHPYIIEAARIEDRSLRNQRIKNLIQQLPFANFSILRLLVEHLRNVARHSQKNLMTISNLGICLAPTLMRGRDDNAPSINEIRFSNVVTNTLIEEFETIFIYPTTTNNTVSPNNYYGQQLCYRAPPLGHFVQIQAPEKNVYHAPPITQYTQIQPSPTFYEQPPWHQLPFYPIISQRSSCPSDKVISIYACVADLDSELSFGPNEIIIDVRPSAEAGWLIGTLERNGQRGLLPENYVKFLFI